MQDVATQHLAILAQHRAFLLTQSAREADDIARRLRALDQEIIRVTRQEREARR